MDISQLLTFVTLAQLKNFNQTAETLHLAQPTISARINALERELGTQLFTRTTRWVEMTEAGKNLLSYSQRILEIAKEMHIAAQAVHGSIPHRIIIATTPTLNYRNFPWFLKQLRQEFPTTKAIVKTGPTQLVLDMVVDGMAHAAMLRSPIYHPEIIVVSLYQEDLHVIVPPYHPLATKKPLLTSDLNNYPMVAHDYGTRGGAWLREVLASKHCSPPVVMELDYVETVKQLVIADVGFAILPVTTVEREVRNLLLATRPIADMPNLKREVVLIFNRKSAHAQEVQAVRKVLKKFYPTSAC